MLDSRMYEICFKKWVAFPKPAAIFWRVFNSKAPPFSDSGGALRFDTFVGGSGWYIPNDKLYTFVDSICLNEGLGNIKISEFRISWQTSC